MINARHAFALVALCLFGSTLASCGAHRGQRTVDEPAKEFRGRVLDTSGRPVSGAVVAGISVDEDIASVVSRTDPDGYFRASVKKAIRFVTVTSSRSPALRAEYEADKELRLDGQRGGRLAGRAILDGTPVADVLLRLRPWGGEAGEHYYTYSDGDGRFSVDVPTADYLIVAQGPEFESGWSIVLEGQNEPVTVHVVLGTKVRQPLSSEARQWLIGHAVSRQRWSSANLAEALGEAQVVGLGEGTHGTHEFHDWKREMIQTLVEKHGFRLFAIEASWSNALVVDRYVTTGEGDPAVALAGLEFWTVDTEEVRQLIDWMRDFNASRPEGDKVRFFGLDIQSVSASGAASLSLVTADAPEIEEPVRELLTELAKPDGARALAKRLSPSELKRALEKLAELRTTLEARRRTEHRSEIERKQWLLSLRHLDVLGQALRLHSLKSFPRKLELRGRAMADNAQWLAEAFGGKKLVIWAHNVHIARTYSYARHPTGCHLGQVFGDTYVALGFAFAKGSFRGRDFRTEEAMKRRGVIPIHLPEPDRSFLESSLAEVPLDQYVIDFRELKPDSNAAGWFQIPRRMREIGAGYSDESDFELRVQSDMYDLIAFVRSTSPTIPTPTGRRGPGQ